MIDEFGHGLPQASRQLTVAWLTLASLGFACIAAAELASASSDAELSLLLVIPVIIIAVAFGIRGGVGAALVVLVLLTIWTFAVDHGLGIVDIGLRVLLCLVVAITVGWLAQETRRETRITRALLDALPDPASVKDLNGNYLFVNRVLAESLKVPRSKAEGQPTGYGSSAATLERVRSAETEVRRTRLPVELEVEERMPDGYSRVYRMLKSPVLDEHGRLQGIVTIAYDITSRVRHEEALVEAATHTQDEYERARSDYARLVRHRLANPLSIIAGAAHAITTPWADEYAHRVELAGLIEAALARIGDLDVDPSATGIEERGLDARPAVSSEVIDEQVKRYRAAMQPRTDT